MRRVPIRKYWDYKIVQEVMDDMEFEILVSRNENGETVLKVHDLQGANLGGIEDEEFEDFDDLMSRFSGCYFDDYFLDPISEEFEEEIDDWKDCTDLYNQLMSLPEERIEDFLWSINVIGLFGMVYDEMGC